MSKSAHRTVLFLCTGNYYRSRIAEALFASVASKMGIGWQAISRGLVLERGVNNVGPIAREAREALALRGIRTGEVLTRMPIHVSEVDLSTAHKIVAFQELEHRPLLVERFPSVLERVEFWDVADAPGVFDLIDAEVKGLIARLLTGGIRTGPPDLSPPAPPVEPEKPRKPFIAKVGRETAGRKGKAVTTVFDTELDEAALQSLATVLKQKCGTGGTVKEGRIEIQGEQRDRVIVELQKLGYQVKRVGG